MLFFTAKTITDNIFNISYMQILSMPNTGSQHVHFFFLFKKSTNIKGI